MKWMEPEVEKLSCANQIEGVITGRSFIKSSILNVYLSPKLEQLSEKYVNVNI